ncbi:MAG TPA: protein-export chaperone SecB [Gammaproteobacteria bacterium]
MAEDTPQAEKQLLLQKIYIKDLSFESPRAPEIFTSNVAPQTRLNIKSGAREIADDNHEVVLTLTVEAVDGDQTLFLVEIEQAGIFRLQGYSREELDMLLGSYCPGTLYPFAREAVADLVSRGGFPQLLLQPINFDALYAQAVRERTQAAAEASEAPPSTH